MAKKFTLAFLTCVLLIATFTPPMQNVEAADDLLLSAFSPEPAVIDGNIGSNEWAEADTATFGPITVGSHTINGTLYMMNYFTTLYMAVAIEGDDDLDEHDAIVLFFDNDDGEETSHEEGDDILLLDGDNLVGDMFYDAYFGYPQSDSADSGTVDTVGSAGRHSGVNHFELAQPLDDSDDAHDFSLSHDDIVGFCLIINVDDIQPDISSYGFGTVNNPSTYSDYQVLLPILSSAAGAPTIDGIMEAGEWDAADSMSFNMDGHAGTLYVMNDATNLYFLFKVTDDDTDDRDEVRINFDNDNGGGSLVTGDDCITCDNAALNDFYYDSGTLSNEDTGDGGTLDGEGAVSQDGSNTWYFEFFHPLDSADNSHDFSLSIGDTVGFCLSYWDYYSGGDYYYNWPAPTYNEDNYGDIIIAPPRFVGMLNFDDYANRMGSMPGVEPSTTLYFPHFHRDSNWQTFYALVNPGTINTDVDVMYYASDGSTISTESFSLDPGHKTGKFPPTGSGWIKVVSDVPIVGMLNFDDYANRMGSMPGVTPASTIYFPHFHRDSSWQTFFALVNPQGSSASIDITYYAIDGSTIDTESFTLDAGHKTGKFTPSGSGWIKVVSSQPIVGMLNFDDYRNRMGSMPGVTTSTTLYFPHFDQGSSWQSYGAIVNPGSTASVTTTFYANDGSIIGSGTDSVGSNCKIGGFTPTGTGWIKVESSVPVVGMVNFDDYSNRMGSMPGATSLFAICYPHFHQDSNWQTYYAIVNSGPDCGLTSAYYASDGSSTGSTSMSLPENNKAGTFPPSGNGWINAPP